MGICTLAPVTLGRGKHIAAHGAKQNDMLQSKGHQMKTQTVRHGSEFWLLHESGAIERPGLVKPHAASWRIVGAVEFDNFGNVTRRYSLADIQSGADIQWKHKDGKQKTRVVDFDHGSRRIWGCSHSIDRVQTERGA